MEEEADSACESVCELRLHGAVFGFPDIWIITT